MFGIHWAAPERIVLAPIVIVLGFLLIRSMRQRLSIAKLLSHENHDGLFLKNFSIMREKYKVFLGLVALGSLMGAIMLPQWGKHDQTVVQEGRDLLVVLDISRSMLAQDFRPSRLMFAKTKIRELVEGLKTERVGLILFSGNAFLHCPLTADHKAFLLFLDQVEVEQIAAGTTAIDNALLHALQVFGQSKDRKNKLVALITDGEDFSLKLDEVKRLATDQNVTLFTLGVGSLEGAPVPKFDRMGNQIGNETEADGSIAMTKLNEPLLQGLAKELNGHYIKMRTDGGDVQELVAQVNKFEKEQFSEQNVSLYEHQYHWFLLLACVCLLVEWLL